MIIHTVMGNRSHPEYGVASIPFPIPTEEYPCIIEMLEALEVGDVLKPDCHIAEIESPLPVLECLEDTDINVDGLDYLAKRLDSLSDHELQQFQAMAAKNGCCKIKDLINLTFSCQTVTVVSDFSDLESIGSCILLIRSQPENIPRLYISSLTVFRITHPLITQTLSLRS